MALYGVLSWDAEGVEHLDICPGPEVARRRLFDLWNEGSSSQGVCMVELTDDGKPGRVVDERVRNPSVAERLGYGCTRRLFEAVDKALKQRRRQC